MQKVYGNVVFNVVINEDGSIKLTSLTGEIKVTVNYKRESNIEKAVLKHIPLPELWGLDNKNKRGNHNDL